MLGIDGLISRGLGRGVRRSRVIGEGRGLESVHVHEVRAKNRVNVDVDIFHCAWNDRGETSKPCRIPKWISDRCELGRKAMRVAGSRETVPR